YNQECTRGREKAPGTSSQEWCSLASSAWEESRSLYVVEAVSDDGAGQPRYFPGVVLSVSCHDDDNIGSLGQCRGVPLLDRVSIALLDRVFDDSNWNCG